jgi:Kef-type K+ transport system membrane component KefB
MLSALYGLTVVLVLAALGAALARFFRQPALLAYLAVGLALPWLGIFDVTNHKETLTLFSDLGLMFLLFLVGLEMNIHSVRQIGRDSFLLGFGQLLFTWVGGFFIALLFSFSTPESFFIGLAFALSSTVLAVGLLAEKKDQSSLYGKLSVGMLLVQDFLVVLVLVLLSGFPKEMTVLSLAGLGSLFFVLLKGIALFVFAFLLGKRIIPFVFERVARSEELVFVVSLAWVFLIAVLTELLGFSIAIGGFLAGLSLANSYEHFQIANRMRSLRDFFLIAFFVFLGSTLSTTITTVHWIPVISFIIFVLVGNAIVVITLAGFLGYRRRTSFFAGILVAQVSEFSFILGYLLHSLGHIQEETVGLITTVGILSIAISAYLINRSEELFSFFKNWLGIFERRRPKETARSLVHKKPVILIGFHRTGQAFASAFSEKDSLLIVDYDPAVILEWKRCGYHYLFGDMNDETVLDEGCFREAHLIISTCPDLANNILLLQTLHKHKKQDNGPSVVVRARTADEADILYLAGADYVFLPDASIGRHLANLFSEGGHVPFATLRREDKELLSKTTCPL